MKYCQQENGGRKMAADPFEWTPPDID